MMQVLVDTNVLLRTIQPLHPMFVQCKKSIATLFRQGHQVCFCPQNVIEFWNVATRPASANGLGLPPGDVLAEIAKIEASLTILPDVPGIYSIWKRLVSVHQVLGVQVHDARLVAVMSVYGIGSILSLNDRDFRRFPGINILTPETVLT